LKKLQGRGGGRSGKIRRARRSKRMMEIVLLKLIIERERDS
jgi:hypothetical protein